MFLRLFVFLLSLSAAVYFGPQVTFSIQGKSVECHSALIVTLVASIYALNLILKLLCRKFVLLFSSGRTKLEKGIDDLQLAFSAILLKDRELAEKRLTRAKKNLGPVPLISWLEGQLKIQYNDIHAARAIFYSLCEREKNTTLGAYSLYKLSLKDGSRSDAINAINAILQISPNSSELLRKAIAISLQSSNFAEARKYLFHLSKFTKTISTISAVVNHEEGVYANNPILLQKAFDQDPGLTRNAILLANHLMADSEYSEARCVLSKSFLQSPHPEVFDKYVSCGKNLSPLESMNLAGKMIKRAPDSWISYYGLANLALEGKMFSLAFQNFLLAYRLESYDFIAEKLKETTALLKDLSESLTMQEILPTLLPQKHVDFVWKCKCCGNQEMEWMPVCDICDAIGEFYYGEQEKSIATAAPRATS
ncbi:MAG: hypothetical protein LBJ19_01470 [Holosporaceae bacterium]|jgi:uncharacterized membrane-anchored protein|nr:hypothetical protein [Holosporaceae bacterium]